MVDSYELGKDFGTFDLGMVLTKYYGTGFQSRKRVFVLIVDKEVTSNANK